MAKIAPSTKSKSTRKTATKSQKPAKLGSGIGSGNRFQGIEKSASSTKKPSNGSAAAQRKKFGTKSLTSLSRSAKRK